jgi:hypothetical protein
LQHHSMRMCMSPPHKNITDALSFSLHDLALMQTMPCEQRHTHGTGTAAGSAIPILTSRVEPLRLREALGVSARPPTLLLLAPAAAAPSAERRGMGASALKKRLSMKTVWIQVRMRCGFLQGARDDTCCQQPILQHMQCALPVGTNKCHLAVTCLRSPYCCRKYAVQWPCVSDVAARRTPHAVAAMCTNI